MTGKNRTNVIGQTKYYVFLKWCFLEEAPVLVSYVYGWSIDVTV